MINNSIFVSRIQKNLIKSNQRSVECDQKIRMIKQKVVNIFGEDNCKLVKEINGTLKFNLAPQMKISTVLQTLQGIRSQILEQREKKKKDEYSKEDLQFEWSINNSSMEDVFFNVVERLSL